MTGWMSDLMEYQAKELFAKHGVATTLGVVVQTAEEARTAAEQLGGVTVVKAQVKAGGRGKAGGVKLAKTRSEEHTSELQSLMRISYAVFCLKKNNTYTTLSPQSTL